MDIDDYQLWSGGYMSYQTLIEEIARVDKRICNEKCVELNKFVNFDYYTNPLFPWQKCDNLSKRLSLVKDHITEDKSFGHIDRAGGMKKCVECLAIGFQIAFDKKEDVRFH